MRAEQRFLEAVWGDASRYANEYRIVSLDGEVHWIRALGEIERDAQGRPLRMVGAHLDVTDLKRAESESAEHARHLLEADRRKDEFLAVLSHELRDPLAALTNALALLARPDAPVGGTARRHRGRAQRGSRARCPVHGTPARALRAAGAWVSARRSASAGPTRRRVCASGRCRAGRPTSRGRR